MHALLPALASNVILDKEATLNPISRTEKIALARDRCLSMTTLPSNITRSPQRVWVGRRWYFNVGCRH